MASFGSLLMFHERTHVNRPSHPPNRAQVDQDEATSAWIATAGIQLLNALCRAEYVW